MISKVSCWANNHDFCTLRLPQCVRERWLIAIPHSDSIFEFIVLSSPGIRCWLAATLSAAPLTDAWEDAKDFLVPEKWKKQKVGNRNKFKVCAKEDWVMDQPRRHG